LRSPTSPTASIRCSAKRAQGRYLENGRITEKLRRKGLKPETRFRPDEEANA